MQHALPGAEITDGPSPTARRLLGSQLVGGGFLTATAALSVPLFAVTAIFFLLFPRVGLGFLSFGEGETTTMAGFGDDVELGGFGRIRDDPSIVMRVTPPNLPEDPPPRAALRMRGTSFDHYDGRRWSRTRDAEREILEIGADYPLLRRRHETDLEFDISDLSSDPGAPSVMVFENGGLDRPNTEYFRLTGHLVAQ